MTQPGNDQFATVKQRFQGMNPGEQVDHLQGRWDVCRDIFELLITAVQEEKIAAWDVYPTVPHTITSVVSNLFGLAPTAGVRELDMATLDGALGQRIQSGYREAAVR